MEGSCRGLKWQLFGVTKGKEDICWALSVAPKRQLASAIRLTLELEDRTCRPCVREHREQYVLAEPPCGCYEISRQVVRYGQYDKVDIYAQLFFPSISVMCSLPFKLEEVRLGHVVGD